jgi:hypothetical protein
METILLVTGTPSTASEISFPVKTSTTVGISSLDEQLHIIKPVSNTIFLILYV